MSGSIFLDETEISVSETSGTVLIPIVRTGDLSLPVTITYGLTADMAERNVDWAGVDGTVTMAAGQSRVTVSAQILDDGLSETSEVFTLSLINVDSGTLFAPRTTRITVLDNENPVVDPPEPPLVSDYDVIAQPVIEGVVQPLKFAFSPVDPSLVYVGEKNGVLKVFDIDNGAQVSTFFDINGKVNQFGDRGLMDIAFHPDFPAQPYVYAFYVVDPSQVQGYEPGNNASYDGGGNRFAYVSRFTADVETNFTTAVPGSEVVLIGNAGQTLADISGGGVLDYTDPTYVAEVSSERMVNPDAAVAPVVIDGFKQDYLKMDSRSHIGGGLAFGPDGMLYISTGDGTSFDIVDPRSLDVQNLNSFAGKVLRVDPMTGLGVADNPFVTPGMDLSTNQAKVYQYGLRNPYSLGFDEDGRLYMSETGWFSWEELNSGDPGANFGWPFYEGGDNGVLLPTSGYRDLPEAAAFYAGVANGTIEITPAFRAFSHASTDPGFQIQAIVASDVIYNGTRYPTEFANDYFFTDFPEGEIYTVDVNDPRDVKFLMKTDTGFGFTHMTQGPDGYVYYADVVTGQIGRLLIDEEPIDPLPVSFATNGSASVEGATGEYTLTTATPFQAGSVMSTTRIDVRQSFTLAFDLYLGASDGGADGVAFLLHDDPAGAATIGTSGGGFGAGGVTRGLGIEFDTWDNTAEAGPGLGDIAADHTLFYGLEGFFRTAAVGLGNLEDGAWHEIAVSWEAATGTLSYTVDGATAGSLAGIDLAGTFLGGSPYAYFGLTGATGGASNLQEVRFTSIDATFEGGGTTNRDPVAMADVAAAVRGTPVTISVLGNDSDPDGDALTVISAITGGDSSVTVGPDGILTYTATGQTPATDTIVYTISDGRGGTATGQVSVSVTDPAVAAFATNGSATVEGATGEYTLTTATPFQAGSVMSTTRIDVRQSFTLAFDLYLGASDGGADGVAFLLHDDPAGAATIGTSGGGFGAGGVTRGLGIEFDTWDNTAEAGPELGDIPADHTLFYGLDGLFRTAAVGLGNLEDGAWHEIAVSWEAATGTLSYTVDGATTGSLAGIDLSATFLGGSPYAHFGLTGATGGASNLQEVRFTGIDATFEGGGATNRDPVAVADVAAALRGTPVTVSVLGNDSDPDGDALTVISAITGGDSSVTVGPDGVLTYTATGQTPATDTIVYTISDGRGGTATGQVSVSVTDPAVAAFATNGSASVEGATGEYTLTTATPFQAGSVMSTTRIDVRQSFTLAFDLYLGEDDAGADGVAFLLHDDPAGAAAIGRAGGGFGVDDVTRGLGIEFDTWDNTAEAGPGLGDIAADHTLFYGLEGFFRTAAVGLANLEDGAWHEIAVSWEAATGTLSYTVDGATAGSLAGIDLAGTFLGGSPYAHFGLLGATGTTVNTQEVRFTSIDATFEGGGSVTGGAADNAIAGDPAGSRLAGGTGDDVLSGTSGDDVFVFAPGGGSDLILDFGDVAGNQDMLDLSNFHFRDVNEALALSAQEGADVVFAFADGELLQLQNVARSALGADDFVI